MLHHYITKYWENGIHYAESWIQIDVGSFCRCFNRKKIIIGKKWWARKKGAIKPL